MIELCRLTYIIALFWHTESLLLLNYSSSLNSPMDDLGILIMSSCYPEHTYIIIYDTSDSDLTEIQETKITSVILYDGLEISSENYDHLDKANAFVISIESPEVLLFEQTLLLLKNFPWWNNMAVFLILDRSNTECKSASRILQKAWDVDILTAIILCYDSNEALKILTYNPYTNRAPDPWKPVGSGNVKHWTLFERFYHQHYYQIENNNFQKNNLNKEHTDICENFHFDRSRYLDGHNFSAFICSYDEQLTKLHEHDNIHAKTKNSSVLVISLLEKALNIKFSVYYHKINSVQLSTAGIYNLKVPIDLFVCSVPLGLYPTRTFILYPIAQYDMVIITRSRGYYTPVEKISNFYGFLTVAAMTVILTLTFCVIVLSQRNPRVSFALFEIIRLIKNSALVTEITTIPLRIFFFSVFIYFIVIHATFSGHLASFLTKKELRQNPEKLDDLMDSKYRAVYVPNFINIYNSSDPKLRKKIIVIDTIDCAVFVVNDSTVACITLKPFVMNVIQPNNLTMSKNPVVQYYYAFHSRDYWPLNERMHKVLMWLSQTHLIYVLIQSSIFDAEEHLRAMIEGSSTKYRRIKFGDIQFAFIFLIAGLFVSVICFLVEILKKKKVNKITAFQISEKPKRLFIKNKKIIGNK